jgi:peptidoglycan/LPS O-acetylase OafA/YrhL
MATDIEQNFLRRNNAADTEGSAQTPASLALRPMFPHSTTRAIRLLLITFVVLIHAHPQRVMEAGHPADDMCRFVRRVIDPGLTGVAVPMFALMSGFLFFFELPLVFGHYRSKIRRRLRTLAVPYLLCSAANLAILLLLQTLPATRQSFTNNADFVLADFGWGEFLHSWLIRPIPIQLWFLRDLIVLVVVSPLLGFAISKFHWAVPLPFGIAWLAGYAATPDDRVFLASTTTAFFLGGGCLAIHAPMLLNAAPPFRRVLLVAWILIAALRTADSLLPVPGRLLQCASILIGITAVWFNADLLSRWLERRWSRWLLTSSFFIYLAHQPLLRVLERFAATLSQVAQRNELFLLLALPGLAIVLCGAAAEILRRVTPKTYRLLTGDR